MSIVMTDAQKAELDERGFLVLENVLSTEEVERVSRSMDEVAERVKRERGLDPADRSLGMRNGIVQSEAILDLIDHPLILSMVVDAYGWNIHNRDSTLNISPPMPAGAPKDVLSLGWHFDYEEEFAGTTVDGTMPLIDFKVGWYISDHTEEGHGRILIVPGSYRWNREQRQSWEQWIDPDEIFELNVPAGSAMLWRPTLLHAVTPNFSQHDRKAIYVSYTPRWMRPSGHLEHDPDLIARSSPVRRQLLGAMGNLTDPLGKDPVNNPNSQYWFTDDWDNVPLKAWAEERAGDRAHDWGTRLGASYTKGPGFTFTQLKVPAKQGR